MEHQVEPMKPGISGDEANGREHPGHEHHIVQIKLDDIPREIERGKYVVSDLKAQFGVPADYELDQVVNGQFDPLANDAEIKIKGGEVFVSHVSRGGSS